MQTLLPTAARLADGVKAAADGAHAATAAVATSTARIVQEL